MPPSPTRALAGRIAGKCDGRQFQGGSGQCPNLKSPSDHSEAARHENEEDDTQNY